MRTAIFVLASLALLAVPAHADTRSWAAVKDRIPAGTQVVVGIDVSQIARTSVYAPVVQAFLDMERDALLSWKPGKRSRGLHSVHALLALGVDIINVGCSIDVTTAVTDVTVLAIAEPRRQVLVAIGLDGFDREKVAACVQRQVETLVMEHGAKAATVAAKIRGNVTEYSIAGEDEKLYVGWLATDVIALTDDPTMQGRLEKMIAGKPAGGDLATMIGKTAATSPAWFAVAKQHRVAEIKGTIKGAYGALAITGGTFRGDAHLVMSSVSAATRSSRLARARLKRAGTAKRQGDLAKLISETTIARAGSEVRISSSLTEEQVVKLIQQLLGKPQ